VAGHFPLTLVTGAGAAARQLDRPGARRRHVDRRSSPCSCAAIYVLLARDHARQPAREKAYAKIEGLAIPQAEPIGK